MMNSVFEKLRSLQDILSAKIELERQIDEIPKALSTKQELVNRLKRSYIEKNEKFEGLKKHIAVIKNQLFEAEKLREQYEGQMDQIKTQREYEALDKEIRDASEKEQGLRKELQREEKNLEEMQHAISRDENLISEQEEELRAEEAEINEQGNAKKEELKALEAQENEITPELEDEMIFKFERIIRNKAGLGIVPLKGDVCTGCHMILPHQFVNDVRQGDKILFCPYCSRILFYKEDDTEFSYFGADDAEGLSDLDFFDETDLDELDDEEDNSIERIDDPMEGEFEDEDLDELVDDDDDDDDDDLMDGELEE